MIGVRRLRIATAIVWLTMGCGHLLGPDAWRSSPSYEVISTLMPLRAWGTMFILIGLLQLISLRRWWRHVALIVGAAVAAMWATSFVAAALVNKLTGANGPSLWGFLSFAQIVDSGRPLRVIHRAR